MKHKTLKQYIQKMYLIRLIISIILFLILIGIIIINPFRNHISPVKLTDISAIDSLYRSNRRNVTLTADSLYYTGVDYTLSNKIRGHFYYTLKEGRCYLFLICDDKISDTSEPMTNFYLQAHLTHNDNMYNTIIASMSEELELPVQDLEEITSGVFINQYAYTHSFESFSIYAINVFMVLLGMNIIVIIFIFCNPYLSLPFFKLRKYGKIRTLYALAEKEFNSSPVIYEDKVFITDSFFFGIAQASRLEVIPLENIVWLYKYKDFSKFHIKKEIHCHLCIVTDRRVLIKIPNISTDMSDEIIRNLQQRFPGIMLGDEKGAL